MTSDSIETDGKPCPLTISDWIALLAAESHVKSGDKHLAVTVLLAACSIVFSGYVAGMIYIATRFGSSGDYIQLIFGVAYFVIFVAVLIHYLTLTRDISDKKDENLKIIRDIVSGKLVDPDEIRKRWENRETPTNAEELLKICEKQIETRWNIVKFLKLTGYSFVGNFKAIKEKIQFDTLNEGEAEKFIAACENRRERAKILMNEIAPVIGFDVIAMTVVATIIHKSNTGSGYELLKGTLFTTFYGHLLIILFMGFIFLFTMLAHYRVHVHAWTAFKERAILQKPPTEERAS